MSPMPSLIPYIIFVFLILFSLISKENTYLLKWNLKNTIEVVIASFFILLNVNIFIQMWFGMINFIDIFPAYVIFAFPILYYVYFSRTGSDNELQVIINTIAVLGIINAIYYLNDNYNMIVLGEVSEFSRDMHEYSRFRADGNEVVTARIWAHNRGHGLLERHSVSSSWIAIGCFAYLTRIPINSIKKRGIIIVITLFTLLLCMNFTSFVGFLLVIVLFEMYIIQIIYGSVFKNSLKIILYTIGCGMLILPILLLLLPSNLINYMNDLFIGQIKLGSGIADYDNYNYIFGFVENLLLYPKNMIVFPIGLLIGDGYSSFSVIGKGNDYGLVETLYTLGLPLFIIILLGLTKLIIKTYQSLKILDFMGSYQARYLRFAMYTTLFIMFHEIHMSVWNTKSILPLLFLSLAIFKRYLIPTQVSPNNVSQSS